MIFPQFDSFVFLLIYKFWIWATKLNQNDSFKTIWTGHFDTSCYSFVQFIMDYFQRKYKFVLRITSSGFAQCYFVCWIFNTLLFWKFRHSSRFISKLTFRVKNCMWFPFLRFYEESLVIFDVIHIVHLQISTTNAPMFTITKLDKRPRYPPH